MKTYMNILKTVAAVLVAGSVAAGCNEDKFLTISSPDEISTADFPTTLDHTSALLTSAYGQIHHWDFYGSCFGGYVMYPLEYDVDWQWRDSADWCGETAGTNEGPTDRVTVSWGSINTGIHYANVAIDGVKSYSKIAQESEEATLKLFHGEALFLRAFYWWHLQNIYGSPDLDGPGIPILKATAGSFADAQVSRSTTRESYQAIAETLEEAIPLLEGQTNKYRVDKWAAVGLLAKTYFFLGDNANAKKYCEMLINNSGKTLVSYNWLRKMYNGDAAYEHNSESLFEIENVYGSSAYIYNQAYKPGTEWSRWDTHCAIDPTGKRKSMDNANQYCHDRNLARFGYTYKAPGNYIHAAETLPENGTIPFNCSYAGYYLDKDYVDGSMAMKMRALGGQALQSDPDPRFFVSVLVPYIDTCTLSGKPAPIGQNMKSKSGGNLWFEEAETGSDRNVDYAFALRKYKFLGGALSSEGNNCSGENNYFMRLPEIYLIYAQILANEGNTTTALEYVNKVHRRAYGQNPNTPSAYDYKSLTDRTKTVDATDQLANDPLKYELWAETFSELVWWSYIRYYKIGQGEAKYYEKVHGPGNDGITMCVFPERHYMQPIPSSEMEKNPNMTQAPGYTN